MVPATPEDKTCVVLAGSPKASAAPIVAIAVISAAAPALGEMVLADFFADGDDNALPADHGAEAESERDSDFDP